MKFKISVFIFFLLLLLLLVVLLWKNTTSAPNPRDSKPHDFLITKGQSVNGIAIKLQKEGLVKNSLAFKILVKVTGKDKKIQAGEYQLSPNLSLMQIANTLVSGPTEFWVTYPEGLRREEIALRTIKTLGLEGKEAQDFWNEFLLKSEGKDGFLYPDTYLFSKNVHAATVVEKLYSTFNNKVTPQMEADVRKTGMSLNQVVILASLVERETKSDEERPIVVGILLKRIKAGWPLQTDATLQYFVATKQCGSGYLPDCEWWKPPTIADKTTKSPYNTYLNKGMPPSPISNPGISSIKAVIYPQDSDYWFYLHDSQGKIHYAKTIEEHNDNIRKYL